MPNSIFLLTRHLCLPGRGSERDRHRLCHRYNCPQLSQAGSGLTPISLRLLVNRVPKSKGRPFHGIHVGVLLNWRCNWSTCLPSALAYGTLPEKLVRWASTTHTTDPTGIKCFVPWGRFAPADDTPGNSLEPHNVLGGGRGLKICHNHIPLLMQNNKSWVQKPASVHRAPLLCISRLSLRNKLTPKSEA